MLILMQLKPRLNNVNQYREEIHLKDCIKRLSKKKKKMYKGEINCIKITRKKMCKGEIHLKDCIKIIRKKMPKINMKIAAYNTELIDKMF